VSAAAAKERNEEGKEERKARMWEERVWQERVWEERIERNGRKAKELSEALISTGEMECLAAPERVWASMPIRHYLNRALT
jgi:flagellar biosynthesis regulator FlaF